MGNNFIFILDRPPLVISLTLAVLVGLHEAIVLQQMHFWLQNPSVAMKQGDTAWIRNPAWREWFPFWNDCTINDILSKLQKQNLLCVKLHGQDAWYTLNYPKLSELQASRPTNLGGCTSDLSNEAENSTDKPSPESKKKTNVPSGPPASNRDIIASLGDAFLAIPDMSEKFPPGPQRNRVYALMGRAYNEYDCEPVYQAIAALSRKPDIQDPLKYVVGTASKIARDNKARLALGRPSSAEEQRIRDETARQINETIVRAGQAHSLTPEERRRILEWYEDERQAGEYIRSETEQIRQALARCSGDELLEVVAGIRLRTLRTEATEVEGLKHVHNYLDQLFESKAAEETGSNHDRKRGSAGKDVDQAAALAAGGGG